MSTYLHIAGACSHLLAATHRSSSDLKNQQACANEVPETDHAASLLSCHASNHRLCESLIAEKCPAECRSVATFLLSTIFLNDYQLVCYHYVPNGGLFDHA